MTSHLSSVNSFTAKFNAEISTSERTILAPFWPNSFAVENLIPVAEPVITTTLFLP